MELKVQKLDKNNLKDFSIIHSEENGYNWCQCVAWWVNSWEEFKNRTSDENLNHRNLLFSKGEYDGYILYLNQSPIGWCQVGIRDRLKKLTSQYRRDPDSSVYAISCFNIIPKFRGKGLAHSFLSLLLLELKSRGVKILEAYPKRNSKDPWTGPESLFIKAGFKIDSENPGLIYKINL